MFYADDPILEEPQCFTDLEVEALEHSYAASTIGHGGPQLARIAFTSDLSRYECGTAFFERAELTVFRMQQGSQELAKRLITRTDLKHEWLLISDDFAESAKFFWEAARGACNGGPPPSKPSWFGRRPATRPGHEGVIGS